MTIVICVLRYNAIKYINDEKCYENVQNVNTWGEEFRMFKDVQFFRPEASKDKIVYYFHDILLV